ncbi:hypothetical protein CVT24_010785 [Panaeolus cyanescens]|uniref:Protein kinase domain-containing protein n=1 Tax=Panaeolus cyanescens TaxID=181874 RepID=A0A409VGR6_9AGAR|nr:hypothetical protein CVT24_010785 [Panaeolus cyanescens]
MSFPQSFSTTADNPPIENSPSSATVRLSTSPTMVQRSRSISFQREAELSRSRTLTESNTFTQSTPTINSVPQQQRQSRMPSPPSMMSHSVSIATLLMSSMRSRSRSRSRAPEGDRPLSVVEKHATSTGWLGKACEYIRPWGDTEGGDEDSEIPVEQKKAFSQTKEAVCNTLKRITGMKTETVLAIVGGTLTVLNCIPFPALQSVTETLIAIWENVKLVAMNRLAFLRLTQTCTTILDSIHQEIEGSGVTQELAGPIAVLERSFESFLSLIRTEVQTPFLMRYLRRDDTAKAIAACNDSLMRALTLFAVTIQIRTYKAVCANSQIRPGERLLEDLTQPASKSGLDSPDRRASVPDGLPSSSSHKSLAATSSIKMSYSTDDLTASSPKVVPALHQIQASQIDEDSKQDLDDLRRLMKKALETGSDAALLNFLQIAHEEMPEAIKTLQRMLEKHTSPLASEQAEDSSFIGDTLHQEFLESGIDALRRMSAGNGFEMNLPFWTITKYEVQKIQRIGMGFFSEVYKGLWRGRIVAIKTLSEVTPAALFIREIKVWKSLDHPNVLKLYGASSATGQHPWFFVSPYMKHGTLVQFLKRIAMHQGEYDHTMRSQLGTIVENLPTSRSRSSFGRVCRVLKAGDMYRMMQEVAKGMEYLHEEGILHGDLKAANILVDDHCRCVIADFGQSEMKSEVCRITGASLMTGTLRWKAPELMDGSSTMSMASDVYAYAILSVEILTMGEMPWAHNDDDAVRYFVLEKGKRPNIPHDFPSPLLQELLDECWHIDPGRRISFVEVVSRLQVLRDEAGACYDPSTAHTYSEYHDELVTSPTMSPRGFYGRPTSGSLRRIPVAQVLRIFVAPSLTSHSGYSETFGSSEYIALPSPQQIDFLRMEETVPTSNANGPVKITMPEPVHYLPDLTVRRKTLRLDDSFVKEDEEVLESSTSTDDSLYSDATAKIDDDRRCDSPPPLNLSAAEARHERRYRLLLEHEFNPSLTLALWHPTLVQVGDVGYLSKPTGTFVVLFNALKPQKTSGGRTGGMPSVAGYGSVSKSSLRLEKRNVAQKGLDVFSGLLRLRGGKGAGDGLPILRRQSFRLRSGHKSAFMYTESADYQYLKKLDAPRAWLQANVDTILSLYGREHSLQKEDIFLAISTLQVQNYALFVSHRHPESQAQFNVFSSPKKGQPWGMFTMDASTVNARLHGPLYEEPMQEEYDCASKVSLVGDPTKSVLVGKLRFRPDSVHPTSAK